MLLREGVRAAERLGLAHLSYQRAVAAAQAESTPATWRRLLTASSNLSAARRAREQERERGREEPERWRPSGAAPGGAVAPLRFLLRTAGGRGTSAPATGRSAWSEVREQWARAQALMAWSRALVSASRALCGWSTVWIAP